MLSVFVRVIIVEIDRDSWHYKWRAKCLKKMGWEFGIDDVSYISYWLDILIGLHIWKCMDVLLDSFIFRKVKFKKKRGKNA